jgi:RES domain-containing protein
LAIPFVSIGIEVPDDLPIATLDRDRLPADWRAEPPSTATQQLGLDWLRTAPSALLRVPSAVIPQEQNYLLNPLHPEASRLTPHAPEPFTFDPRLRR